MGGWIGEHIVDPLIGGVESIGSGINEWIIKPTTSTISDVVHDPGVLLDVEWWITPQGAWADLYTPEMPNSPTYASNQIGNTITEGLPVARCYGRCKIGGNKIRFNDKDDTDLRIIVAHCQGPVEGSSEWYVNDIAWGDLTGSHTKTEYTGTRTQTVDGRFTSRASAYRSIAYTAFTFIKNDKQIGYDPNITVIMQGLKCVPLAGGADVFTRNPAVILYDFYLNVEGKSAGDLDLNSFKSLEALCNEVPTGSTLPRYRFDFNFDTNMTINDAKKLLWQSFNGQVIMSQGKYKCVWDSSQVADGSGGLKAKTVSHAFTEDNIVKDSFTWDQPEPPNVVRIHYIDSANSYQKTSVEVRDENDIEINGEIVFEETCYYITDAEVARRRAQYKFNKAKYTDYNCSLKGFSDSSDLEIYDLVTVTHQLPGWTTKRFLVTSKTEGQYGQPIFKLSAYYSGVYDDAQVGDQAGYESNLPNPYKVPAASTDISAAMTAVGTSYDFDAVRVSFTPPANDPFYAYSEIYASNDDSTYYYIGRDGTGTFTFNALGVVYEPGDTCYIKIRSVSTYGVPEDLPAVASTSVLISSTMRLGGFYAGLTFFGDNETPADAKILLDKTNTLMRLGDTATPYLVLDGEYSGVPAVRSSDYVSGFMGAGFLLKHNLLEVGNIASRGIIRTSVFETNSVTVNSGSNITVKGGDVLVEDMSAEDSDDIVRITEVGDIRITEAGDTRTLDGHALLTIEGNDTFAVGDILYIKEGFDAEWMRIESTDDAPIYTVTRDLAGNYADGSNPQWTKGASVVNYGQSGDGGIYLTASDTNAPHLSIFTHAGEPWNSITTHIREGNLNGYAGYSSDIYGWASYIDANNYIKIDPVNGIRMSGEIVITGGSGLSSLSDAGALATEDDLDGVPDGSSYGRVAKTAISAGKIVLTSSGVTGTLPTSLSDAKCTDANADQTSVNTAANIAGQGSLATQNDVAEGDLQSGVTGRMFLDAATKANIEAWRKAGSPTYLDGAYIYAKTITADKFISTLYGDMNQAMDYVKTVLGAGDEYEHDLTDTDLSNGSETNGDADTHFDYGISVRISTAKEWDDGGVWDTGTWDEPTDSSGSWTSASMDLGSSKTLQLALRYTTVEETPASTTETIKLQYSTNNVDFGANSPAFDDGLWETAPINNITGDIYKATGALFTFRYFKVKIELATTVTTDRIILHTMTYLGNVVNLFGMESNKAIASGGTTIDLSGFHTTPAITVTPVGSTALVPLITAQSSSSVTIKLYNLSGSAVGGNANITIIGV